MLETLTAKVEKKFPIVTKKIKDGSEFQTQKIVLVWDENEDYPSRIVLEQGGEKKIELASHLEEGKTYTFSLSWRANYWTNPEGVGMAFGSISAWRAEPESESFDKENFPF